MISAGEVLIEPTRRAFAELVEAPFARARVDIEAAVLGAQAGAIGAGLLASTSAGAGRARCRLQRRRAGAR